MTLEERIEKIKDLRPIDDVFFEVLAQDKEVCEEMLRTIMEDDLLAVSDVTVQSSERNLTFSKAGRIVYIRKWHIMQYRSTAF